jgi:transposase InsO family protein
VRREVSVSLKQVVALKAVCEVAGVARSSVYFSRKAVASLVTMSTPKRGPVGEFTDAQLVEQIRAVLADTPFLGEGYRKVWAKLRHRGVRTSRARVLRLMREHGLRSPTRSGTVRGPRNHDGTIIPEAPDLRWGTDLTGTWTTQDGGVSVMLTVDHHTAEILGIHAAKRATRWEALEPVRQAVRRVFGGIRANAATGLQLRHDHGSQYISADFQNEIRFLGIESSPAFVRAPEGNGCVERAIRTLKEQLLWVRSFDTVEELRIALLDWAKLYNEKWLIERHGFKSPAQRRREYYAATEKLAA